jgi:hypothetical protein
MPSDQNAIRSLERASGSSWPETLHRPLKAIQEHVEERELFNPVDVGCPSYPGLNIPKFFLKLRFEYYWELHFEMCVPIRGTTWVVLLLGKGLATSTYPMGEPLLLTVTLS